MWEVSLENLIIFEEKFGEFSMQPFKVIIAYRPLPVSIITIIIIPSVHEDEGDWHLTQNRQRISQSIAHNVTFQSSKASNIHTHRGNVYAIKNKMSIRVLIYVWYWHKKKVHRIKSFILRILWGFEVHRELRNKLIRTFGMQKTIFRHFCIFFTPFSDIWISTT